ncbi:MAG: hypothetical protein WCI46_01180 [Verrucomicrobiota bacterium]
MKKFLQWSLLLLLGIGLSFALWNFRDHLAPTPNPSPDPSPESSTQESPPENFAVSLDQEKITALDLKSVKLSPLKLQPSRIAYGQVIDPAPLLALDLDLSTAETALHLSQADFERTQSLFKNGENLALKSLQTAQAQFQTDQLKLLALRRTATLNWSTAFPSLNPSLRHTFADQLANNQTVILRVDLLPGDALTQKVVSAKIVAFNHDDQPILTDNLTPAPNTDPKTQAQGFFLIVNQSPFPLRPGNAATAWITIDQPPINGFALPRSAILRHDGRTWIYLQESTQFLRVPITLLSPLEDEKGWFIPDQHGITADQLVVISGAQSLLSEELKSKTTPDPE